MKRKKGQGRLLEKINNPKLFILVIILLSISIGTILFGLGRNDDLVEISESLETARIENESEDGVSSLFEDEFARDRGPDDEGRIFGEDPFRESCAGLGGGETPIIVGFTACP